MLFIALLVAVWPGRWIWDRCVHWHLRMRYHFWCLPVAAVVGLGSSLTALFFELTRFSEVLLITCLATGGFVSLIVGARCPDCGGRLRYRPRRYGPVRYDCRACGFSWEGWGLQDPLP